MNYRRLAVVAVATALAACCILSVALAAEDSASALEPGGAAVPPVSTDAAVAQPADSPEAGAAPVEAPEGYRIVEEDVLQIDVWGEPQLTKLQVQVTPDGKINVAFIGELQVVGMTIPELSAEISRRLEEAQIIADAQIQIALMKIHEPIARVLGEVARPGAITFKEGDTILDAVAQAGSYTDNAWLEKATLTHKNSSTPIPIDVKKMLDGDLSQNYPLQNGDAIYIPPEDYQNKIYVLGYVLRPGIYDLKDKTTVLSAISLAGGPTPRGALKGTAVVRGNPATPERVPCDLTRLFDKADLSQDIVLQPGDVVIVPETKKPDWGVISSILGTILNITYIRRYGLF